MPNRLPATFSTGLLDNWIGSSTSGTAATGGTNGTRAGVHVGEFLARDRWAGTLGNPHPIEISSARATIESGAVSDLVAVRPAAVAAKPTASLQTRQVWQGVVESVHGPEFVAILTDRTDPLRPDEEASFDLDEVSPSERHLIQPGAVFYFFVGTEHTPGGQQKNVSIIKLQRLPSWTRRALERVDARARRIMGVLGLP